MANFRLIRQLWERSPQRNFVSWRRRSRARRITVFDEQHPLLFVLSTGRVGTQTLAALAGLVPDILARHEPAPKLYGLSKLSYSLGDHTAVQQVLAEAFLTARRELLQLALATGQGYVETSPQLTFLAPVIRQIWPEARFIHLVRSPEVVIRSAMRRQWYAGNRTDETRITPGTDNPFARHWSEWTALQKNYWLWAETNRWISAFGSTLPSAQFVCLRSDDLFTAEDGALKLLYTLLNRPVPAHRRLRRILRQNLNAQRIGQYQPPTDLTTALGLALHDFVAKTAAAFELPFAGDEDGK